MLFAVPFASATCEFTLFNEPLILSRFHFFFFLLSLIFSHLLCVGCDLKGKEELLLLLLGEPATYLSWFVTILALLFSRLKFHAFSFLFRLYYLHWIRQFVSFLIIIIGFSVTHSLVRRAFFFPSCFTIFVWIITCLDQIIVNFFIIRIGFSVNSSLLQRF